MKVRIGNDIDLKIQMTFADSADILNIHEIEAILVNTTLQTELKKEFKKKNRFFGRFPIEPFVNEFEPSAYNIHSTGLPRYRAFVHTPYQGFGWKPDWKEAMPIKDMNVTVYRAEVRHTVDADTVIVSFPAEAQLFAGEYSLIIRAKIYAPGYKHNQKTVCVDYSNVFELVETSAEADRDSSVLLEISNHSSDEPRQDVYVEAGNYDNDSIRLTRNDRGVIDIDVSPISGWYENEE